jgi:purine-binding chemotaxis protein CheW
MNGKAGQKKTGDLVNKTIRWEDVYRRLGEAGLQVQETLHPSPERRRTILKDRARELAKPGRKMSGDEKRTMVVEFDLAREHYAVESAYVREVIPLREFTPIPGTPAFILGIIAVHGRIVSLMDLRRCLGLPPTGIINGSRAILLADDTMEFAILADRVMGLRSLRGDSLQPSVTTITGAGAEYLLGVAADGLIVFDGRKILADSRLVVRSGEEW